MLEVDGYTVHSRIHSTPHSDVFAGSRRADGTSAVLKLYHGAPEACSLRARREFELLSRIDHPGVARALEVRPFYDRHLLILARFPGDPLSRNARPRRFTSAEFLSIALGIAQSLAAVHEARVIHKDVKPGNILLDPQSLRTCLIDFGLSAEFGRAERSARALEAEGTLHYVAPEQTGRLGRGVDFRTDLYSLGASLYELLTGKPPFASLSEHEVIHAHVALDPRAACDVDATIPRGFSRMLEKLLQKDPELRYQTARGLAADLETWEKQLQTTGEMDDELVLGMQDSSDRLRFPNRIYGRARECEELRSAFGRIARGAVEIVLLAGPSGIGKSALAGVLREPLVAAGGYLVETKFDPDQQERPYAGFARVIDHLVDQFLTESDARLATWRERIRSEVGEIGGALIELVPNLALVVSDFPPLAALPAREARERLAAAVSRLVRVVAQTAHPLVLFLDDLQWADRDSLFLLDAILRGSEARALLVVGGYRDASLPAEHPLTAWLAGLEASPVPVQRMPLGPLRVPDIEQILADTLGRSPKDVAWLAQRVGLKSQHNPLLVRRLLFHLWDRDLIWHEHERGWVWDEIRITEVDLTDDAADVVASRIGELGEKGRRLLETASLIGNVFELDLLVTIAGVDRLDALQHLMQLVEQSLISPCREGFKFAHDRIREAARAGIPDSAALAIHHRIALLLLDRLTGPELAARIFEVAEHLHRAASQIDGEVRIRAIHVAQQAGATALRTGAPQSAAHYLGFARSLVRASDWTTDASTLAELFLQSSECAYQTHEFARGLEFLSTLDSVALPAEPRLRVDVQRIRLFTASHSTQETLDLALQTLRRYRVRWPRRPGRLRSRWEIWRTDWALRGAPEEWTLAAAQSPSIERLAPLAIKIAAGQAFSLTSVRFVCRTSGDSLRMYLRDGFVRSPGFSIAAYGAYRAAILGHLDGLKRYADAALTWSRRLPDPAYGPKTEYLLQAFVYVWIRPRRSVVAPLAEVARELREIGDVEYATNALYFRCFPLSLSGTPLPETLAAFDRLPAWLGMDAAAQAGSLAEPFRRLADPARPVTDATLGEVERVLDEFSGSSSGPFLVTNWLLCLGVLGRHADVLRLSERVRAVIFEVHSTGSHVIDYTFFRGLAAAVVARRAVLRASLRRLETWAVHAPDCAHMVEILRAEELALGGSVAPALARYLSAAQKARAAGYTHHAALCHERRADLLMRERRVLEARTDRSAAIALYREWGALTKVAQLESYVEPEA